MLTPELREALDALLAADGEGSGGAGTDRRPRLVPLKRLTQSTAVKAVRARVANLVEIGTLHERLHDVLPAIDLGREGIAYFAGGVLRGRLSQLHHPRSDLRTNAGFRRTSNDRPFSF